MQQYITYILIYICFTYIVFPTFSQTQEKGNWLLSRTPPTIDQDKKEKKKHFENFADQINTLLDNNIIPQAFDRNIAGEMIILSQTAPPAQSTKNWILQSYKTEKDMLKDIEDKSTKRIYPIGLDVQEDAAYILFLQSQLTLKSFRLIKVGTQDILIKSIEDYLELGFIPTAMSHFNSDIWIMLANYQEINTDTIEFQIKTSPLNDIGNTLTTILQNEESQIRSFTTINSKTLLIIQHKK